MKRSFRWIAACLTLVTVFLIPSNALASEVQGKYISELAVAEAKSFDEAKEAFEKASFEIVRESNLNRTLKTGVYLGYKTTDDAEEAIRDAAAMNMTGKYSYGDYKAIMESYKEQIRETIENFLPSLEEFQTNYDAGTPKAMMAYEALNTYVDPDTRILMGDYFADYDYKASSEKALTGKLVEANTNVVLSMMTAVMIGADREDSTVVDRLSSLGPDGLDEVYTGASLTKAQARQKMAAEFGDTASEIRKQWNDFYRYLLAAEENLLITDENGLAFDVAEDALETEIDFDTEGIDLTAEEEELLERLKTIYEGMTEAEKATAVSIYLLLDAAPYGDGTLLEYFKRPAEEVEEEELYPLVFAMSEGQKGQVGMLGLKELLIGGFIEPEEDAAELPESAEPISIYAGVDRSVYDEGVAFTGAAVVHEAQTGENWMTKFGNTMTSRDYWSGMTVASWVTTGVTFITGTISVGIMMAMKEKMRTAYADNDLFYRATEALKGTKNAASQFNKLASEGFTDTELEKLASLHKYGQKLGDSIADASVETATEWERYKLVGGYAAVTGFISFLLFTLSVYYNIRSIMEFCNQAEPTEEAIPHHLLTALETEYGEDYVYYETVKDLNGDPADVNNHEGDKEIGWLVLYATKETAAGKPMLAKDLRVVTGRKNVGADSAFLHLFNETAALAVTSELYTGTADPEDGTYVLFDRDASLTGSAVTGGVIAIVALGGAALGFAGGMLLPKCGKKKRAAA